MCRIKHLIVCTCVLMNNKDLFEFEFESQFEQQPPLPLLLLTLRSDTIQTRLLVAGCWKPSLWGIRTAPEMRKQMSLITLT